MRRRRRIAQDGRWHTLFIIAWLLVCILMLLRWRCTYGPPSL